MQISLILKNILPIPACKIFCCQLLQQAILICLLLLSHFSVKAATYAVILAPNQAGATKLTAKLSILLIYSYLYVLHKHKYGSFSLYYVVEVGV